MDDSSSNVWAQTSHWLKEKTRMGGKKTPRMFAWLAHFSDVPNTHDFQAKCSQTVSRFEALRHGSQIKSNDFPGRKKWVRGRKKKSQGRKKNGIKTGNEILQYEPTCNRSLFASTGVTFQLSKQMKPLAGQDRVDQQRGGNLQSLLITLNQFSQLTPEAGHDRMPPSC